MRLDLRGSFESKCALSSLTASSDCRVVWCTGQASLLRCLTCTSLLAVQFDYGVYNKRLPPGERSALQGISSTRALLERTFRRRVLALPNLNLRSGVLAAGLLMSPDGSRVTGVRIALLGTIVGSDPKMHTARTFSIGEWQLW